jgi:hypothetical protein
VWLCHSGVVCGGHAQAQTTVALTQHFLAVVRLRSAAAAAAAGVLTAETVQAAKQEVQPRL